MRDLIRCFWVAGSLRMALCSCGKSVSTCFRMGNDFFPGIPVWLGSPLKGRS